MKKLYALALSLCSVPAAAQSLGQAKIDSTMIEAVVYKVIGDRSEALKDLPSTFPVVILNQKKIDAAGVETETRIGFAVNCKGRDPRAVVSAFGEVFLDLDNPEVVTEADLNDAYQIANQPILRCDALNGQNQVSPEFSQVFRVIDRAAKKSYNLVRFNAFSPLDKGLFEVGCSSIFDNFWKESADRPIIPVLKESLKDLPGFEDIGALHCFNSTTPVAQNLTYGSFPEPEPVFDARVYRVEDPERGLVRVLLTGGKTFRLNCSAADGELQTGFGLPLTGKLETITSVDPAFTDYVNGQMDAQPTLNCPSLSRPQFASDAYQVINFAGLDARTAARNPLLRLSAAEDALVQFNCESATQLFAKKMVDDLVANPGKLQPMTWESSDFVVRKYLPGQLKSKRYTLGCAPGLLPANDIKQLIRDVMGREPQSGEVSLHMNQCSSQGALCTKSWMEQKIVDRALQTPQATARTIITAFAGGGGYPGALGRLPQPEEMNAFQRKFRTAGSLRAHYKEVIAYLKTAKFLDRALFVEKMKTSAGTEFFLDAMDLWTMKQLDNPTRVYTADLFKSELEAYFKGNNAYLEDVIRRAFEFNYWSGVQAFQVTAMKAKITAGAVRALYEDMSNLLKNSGQTCVTVAANKEDQTFTFFRPAWKVATISGTWTGDKVAYPLVGPIGYTGTTAKAQRFEEKFPFGQLLIATKDSAGAWLPWTGWTGSLAYDHYINEVKLVMNDLRGAFGDNNGSIKICFE